MIWFTSDLHKGHANIIKYCNRPFGEVGEMDAILTRNWNDAIACDDYVYFLGDMMFTKDMEEFGRFVESLHGKIYWLKGNHDPSMEKCIKAARNIVDISENRVIMLDDTPVFLTHRPIHAHPKLVTLCGHVHEKWKVLGKGTKVKEFKGKQEITLFNTIINVGVDVWNFKPITSKEILELVRNPPDKHTDITE